MKKLFLYLFPVFLVFSCKENRPEDTQTTPTQPSTVNNSTQMPPLDENIRQDLLTSCNYIDIIFFNREISMSLTEKSSIDQLLTVITDRAPDYETSSCKPVGRLFFQSNGREMIAADLFLGSEPCRHLVFYQDNKPVYASALDDRGVSLFSQYVNQGIQLQSGSGQ